MTSHLQRRVDKIKQSLLELGGLVEQALERSIRAFEERDISLAELVINGDADVDLKEIEIEECLATLALEQPVAFDLRYVVAVIKMNTDLERIGDLAVNIAEQARFLAQERQLTRIPFDLPGMANIVKRMVNQCLDALVNVDVDLANQVRRSDDRVDDIYRHTFQQVEWEIRKNPAQVEQLVHLLNIARQLERVADHAVNIAEDVLYLAKGEIFRHELAQRAAHVADGD